MLVLLKLCLCCLIWSNSLAEAAELKANCKTNPYRVAIIELGPLANSQGMIRALMRKLMDNKYLPDYQFENTFKFDDAMLYHLRMVQDLSKNCLKFPEGSLYNAGWDHEKLKTMAAEIKDKIKRKEYDMVWAIGNHAIDLMCDEKSPVPILGMMCADPNRLSEPEFSQYPNVHKLIEKRLFADFVAGYQSMYEHKTIGVLKDRNSLFDSYADIKRLENLCQEQGVKLQVCEGTFFTSDLELAHNEFSRCMLELANQKVEAVYLSELAAGPDLNNLYSQIKPLLQQKIFLYSFESAEQVKAGSLMGFYDDKQESRASFEYDTIISLFKGNKLERLSQSINVPYSYAINLKTASILQWRPSFSMLVAADEIFQSIDSD